MMICITASVASAQRSDEGETVEFILHLLGAFLATHTCRTVLLTNTHSHTLTYTLALHYPPLHRSMSQPVKPTERLRSTLLYCAFL